MSDIINNPIVSSLQISDLDDINSCNVIYILAYNNSEPINEEIYNLMINKEIFNEISKKLILIKAPKLLFKNYNHLTRINILSSNAIKKYNIYNYELEDKNLVLPILNISYDNIKLYISQFESTNKLENIFKLLTLNNYFNVDIKNNILDYLQQNIMNLNENNYWTDNYNLTKHFEDRKLNYNYLKNINKELEDYLKDIYKNNNYTDPSKIILKYKFSINNNNIFTKEDIVKLLDKIPEKQQFLLICNLLITKSYCNLILNNIDVLKIIKTKFKMYAQLFRYLISYAWIIFYFEESIKKSYITKDDQFIFDIDTASELPVYPFSMKYPKLNPYMPILVSDKALNSEFNIGCVTEYKKKTKININNGIANLSEFKKNLNIFCTGDPNFNIFQNINWIEDKIGLGGSVMCACIQKYHPLNNNFNNYENEDERLKRYYSEYYSKSDIDIMFLSDNYFDFYDRVKRFYNQIVINVCKNNLYAEPQHFKLKCEKQVFLFISDNDIEKVLDLNKNLKKEDIINNLENSNIKIYFKSLLDSEISKYKDMLLSKLSFEELEKYKKNYPNYIDFDNIIFKLRLNIKSENNEKNICIRYKYKILSPHLDYPFELFMVKYNDFFATVNTFHLPCVRAYYDGTNVYMTPSCISAHLTYMNLDYKYFTGNSNPIEIINKYRMRGFGTWLNEDEKILYLKYSKDIPFWNNLYNINLKIVKSIESVLGSLDLNNKLYMPRIYNIDYFYEDIPVDINKGYSVMHPLTNYKIVSKLEYFIEIDEIFNNKTSVINNIIQKLETINNKGSINPIEKWIIEACWNSINNIDNLESNDTTNKNAIKYKIIY